MDIAELSVRRPVLMTMVYVLICVIALVFLPRLDMALYPDIDMPVISVSVSCNDAGPEEIELQVTEIMEEARNRVQSLLDRFLLYPELDLEFLEKEFPLTNGN